MLRYLAICIFSLVIAVGGYHLSAKAGSNFVSEGVVSSATELSTPKQEVLLTISGLINKTNSSDEALFDLPMLQSLSPYHLETHTLITDGLQRFDGVLMRDVLEAVAIDKSATMVLATALNDYQVKIPLSDFYAYDVILATHMNEEALRPIEKGPLWIVYPRDQFRKLQDIRFDYKWVWQLTKIHVY